MPTLDSVFARLAREREPQSPPRSGYVGRQTAGRRVPRTQDEVMVAATRDDCLILRDYSVVAAVGVGSIDDAMLSALESQSKRNAFRALLKQLRFEVQLLIGTRPQNLDPFRAELVARLDALEALEARLAQFRDGIGVYVKGVLVNGRAGEGEFESRFGWKTASLRGVPGPAVLAARALVQPELPLALTRRTAAELERYVADAQALVQRSVDAVAHWQTAIYDRDAFLEHTLRERYAPVRTFLLVTGFNPRLITKSVRRGPLGEAEFAHARDELARRCDFMIERIERMGLPVWRATSDELLLDVSLFYHPSNPDLQRRDARYERSLATQRAEVLSGRSA